MVGGLLLSLPVSPITLVSCQKITLIMRDRGWVHGLIVMKGIPRPSITKMLPKSCP